MQAATDPKLAVDVSQVLQDHEEDATIMKGFPHHFEPASMYKVQPKD
jgi:hypothetical protein